MKLKKDWLDRQNIIIDDINKLEISMFQKIPKSIRINTLKIKKKDILEMLNKKGWKFKQVPFFEDGYIFENDVYGIGNSLEHFLGYIYKQEVASMVPPIILNPKNEIILDMAAAPGSKTTQIAQLMNNEGCIVANEKNQKRIYSLQENIQRCGVVNTLIAKTDGRNFGKLNIEFDKILLDAPCTGTGIIMKSPKTAKIWSEKTTKNYSELQKQLIKSAYNSLKDSGMIVYSTCSLEPEENEDVVNYAIQELGMKVKDIKLKNFKTRKSITQWKNKKFDNEVEKAVRIYPHDNNTTGFFIAKLIK